MKNFKNVFIALTTVFSMSAFSGGNSIGDVISALRAGNTTALAKYFDNTVEVSLPGKTATYSKGQCEAVLSDFFANNAVKSFSVIHQGESGGSQFCIGKLVTAGGTYRTTVNLKQRGEKQILQEIKFEKQ